MFCRTLPRENRLLCGKGLLALIICIQKTHKDNNGSTVDMEPLLHMEYISLGHSKYTWP